MSEVLDITSIVVMGAGSIAVTVAVFYSAKQTRMLKEQLELQQEQAKLSVTVQQAANDMQLTGRMMTLDRLFIDAPELHRYFYSAAEMPDDERRRTRVIAAAELILDLADIVANMIRLEQLEGEDESSWEIALKRWGLSPAVRYVADQGEGAWPDTTLRHLFDDDLPAAT